jgi:hypothetical protein
MHRDRHGDQQIKIGNPRPLTIARNFSKNPKNGLQNPKNGLRSFIWKGLGGKRFELKNGQKPFFTFFGFVFPILAMPGAFFAAPDSRIYF